MPVKFGDLRRCTAGAACKMAAACDFLVPVLAAGGSGIVLPGAAQLESVPHVKTKKLLFACGSDTGKIFDRDAVLSKELGVALNGAGKRAFPVLVAVEGDTLESYSEREVADWVAEGVVLVPLKKPSTAAMREIAAAHKTTGPGDKVFWGHMALVLMLAKHARATFVVEAGSAMRGGDQMAHYLDRLGAKAAVSLRVKKRDGMGSYTHERLGEYARLQRTTPEWRRVVAKNPKPKPG
jgi:hypothetical protein